MGKRIHTGKRYTEEEKVVSFFFRLMENMVIDPESGCWLYQGTVGNECGHTKIKFKDKVEQTHRIVKQLEVGRKLNPKEQVQHRPELCRNKNCFRPDHLKIGDAGENARDRKIEGTASVPRPRLKKSVREAAELSLRAGKGPTEVSKTLHINRVTVSNLKKRLGIK